jgi:hypothetical protein
MAQDKFYRWVSHPAELEQFRRFRTIHSTNPKGGGKTWFTNQRIESTAEAQMVLALPNAPRHRVGPIPEDEMPYFNVCAARTVEPAYDNPGGGLEFCTTGYIEIFGWFSFDSVSWEPF